MKKKEIVLIFRKKYPDTYSIEFVFDKLFATLQSSHRIKKYVLPRFSNSSLNRVINLFPMLLLRHKIVHVTGDVHYIILGAWFSKRILTIHDLGFMHQNKGVKRSILKWLYIVLPVKFAHQVTVVSEATKTDLQNYVAVDPQKVKVIPDFISAVFKSVLNRSFDQKQPQILQIGTAFNKNIERLAEALADIPCNLTIIGKLNDAQKSCLQKFRIAYKNKTGLTEQEVFQEYQNAHLLTIISTTEGFGMPIIEAQTCGLPVITSNCAAMPEVAGNAALQVNPFDVDAIKAGILDLINNEYLRDKLIKQGFENVKRFSKEKVIAQYALLYQEL